VQGNPIMASMLRSVDECFGRVLDALEKHGLAENTIVIFNSDNGGNTHSNTGESAKERRRKPNDPQTADWRQWAGTQPPTSNAPLRDGKGTLYEGGTRVPLLWSWPGRIAPGATSDAVVGPIDVYPTVLELLGLLHPAAQKMDGVSYARVLRAEGALEPRAYFDYHPHAGNGRAGGVWVRSGDWKLLRWFGYPPGDAARHELYHLRDDLGEAKNLAAAEPARVRELDALIDAFERDTGALFPQPNPAYKPRRRP
jgi:arylsulfatase A-like enzyme